MSVVGIKEVVRRIKEEELITGLDGRDLSNPEGTGIDLRLGCVHKIVEGGAYIEADGAAGLGKRKGVKTEEVCKLKEGDVQDDLIIAPGEYYLIRGAACFALGSCSLRPRPTRATRGSSPSGSPTSAPTR